MNRPQYRQEFPDFDLDVEIPAHWYDNSWHNDVCPSWHVVIPHGVLRVFIDYADPEMREMQGERFGVSMWTHDYDYIQDVMLTDDWSAVLRKVDQIETILKANEVVYGNQVTV